MPTPAPKPPSRADCTCGTRSAAAEPAVDRPGGTLLEDAADLFRVLGDTTRTRILWAIADEGRCVCDIADRLAMTPSAISHQLRILKQARIVRHRKVGRSVFYTLDDDHIRTLLRDAMEHAAEMAPPARPGGRRRIRT